MLAPGGIGWGEAAEHTSTRAARRFGLDARGVIEIGACADIAVLRPDALAYADDVREPPWPARGVEHVFVNGTHAVADGAVTGLRGGRALRGPGAA